MGVLQTVREAGAVTGRLLREKLLQVMLLQAPRAAEEAAQLQSGMQQPKSQRTQRRMARHMTQREQMRTRSM